MTDKGPLLAKGRTAEIFAWGSDQVLKLYRSGWSAESAQYEFHQAMASQQTGYRVPIVGELIGIDGRHGITYQRVEGYTMLQSMMKSPWKLPYFGSQMAQLHVEMHARPAEGLIQVNERLANKIRRTSHLDQATKKAVLRHLDSLPQDGKLLHGDFHPDNIILTADGPMIIDWIDAAVGHPLADVARTMVIADVGIPPGSLLLRGVIKAFTRPYLRTYFSHSQFSGIDLDTWRLPVAAARLEENIPHEIEPLLRMIRRLLVN